MSFINASMRSTVNFQRIIEDVAIRKQAAIGAAEAAGLEYLRSETPVLTGALVSTAEAHENQFSVWFTLAGTLDGKPYGFAQEYGWHDRGGGWHPGHHMVENTALVALEAFEYAFTGTIRIGPSPQMVVLSDVYGRGSGGQGFGGLSPGGF